MGRMKGKKKISDAEMKRRLIADADNPDAWEDPITVPASTAPRPDWYGRTKKISRTTRKSTRSRKTATSKRPVTANKSRAA